MNLKKAFVSFMAAGTILAGGFVGAAAQSAPTTTGTVVVVGAGTFDPQFCEALELDSESVTSATGATAEGTVTICVVDDVAYRGVQNISLSAIDFTPLDTSINASIPAENLGIVTTHNPLQARWSSDICGPVLGDGSNRPCVGDAAGLANNGTTRVTSGSVNWTTSGSLADQGQPILHFYNGSGTSAAVGVEGTFAALDVELDIPAAQRPATYQTTLTLDVTPGHP